MSVVDEWLDDVVEMSMGLCVCTHIAVHV